MSEAKTINLKKPLQSPEGEVKRIVLREPTFDEYLVHGDPYTIAASAGGSPFMVENAEVIATYIKVCLVEPKDPAILSQGKAKLGKEVKEAVLAFFRPDAETGEASAT
ncbi:hypothetical protein [Bradyrhizobium sp. Ec3.3]|uniref:hypothetical protein n=1 Tax=Bradyrhizobium sp. Ec3.3 TaxID=189753 RepID=UPI0003F95DB6|nr:hypothetical protein [Bradyrhizobium sp. Ec3.3]